MLGIYKYGKEINMGHKCLFEDNTTVCLEINNELWVKEYENKRQGRTYRVNFCPECGFKIPKVNDFKSYIHSLNISDNSPNDCIAIFSQSLANAIAQMNHNVELIKCFMSSQNIQNECFMERDLQVSQDICKLERQILNIEKTILKRDE
jgi:hypothetical protein